MPQPVHFPITPKACLCAIVLIISLNWKISAAIYTSQANGAWTSNASWTCDTAPCTYPKASDNVIINHTITLNSNLAVGQAMTGYPLIVNQIRINTGGVLDSSGYNIYIDRDENINSGCTITNSAVVVSGVLLANNLTLLEACMFVTGVAGTIASGNRPGFVKLENNLLIDQKGDLRIAGLYLVEGVVTATQGNVEITGDGYFGAAGGGNYQGNSTTPVGTAASNLSYCGNPTILSCPSSPICNSTSGTGCEKVCRAYVCSGYTNLYPLPIDLISFTASYESASKRVRLEWITASETNNDYFVVEESKDAIKFEEITTIKGAGNSTSVQTYEAFDNEPLPGINYYRLKQVDLDGKFTYSKVVTVIQDDSAFAISPNPSDGKSVQIQWNVPFNGAIIQVYNQVGKSIFRQVVSNNDSELKINFEQALKDGIYFIKVQSQNQQFIHKLIVHN